MFTNKIPSAGFSQTNENATILFLALVYSFFCRLVASVLSVSFLTSRRTVSEIFLSDQNKNANMLRQPKILLRGQSLCDSVRVFSAKPARAFDSSFETEWKNAKPYESIPGMKRLETIRRFLPGGKFNKLPLVDLHR